MRGGGGGDDGNRLVLLLCSLKVSIGSEGLITFDKKTLRRVDTFFSHLVSS